MSRITDALATLLVATRYSLAFCWKYSKKETLGRIIVSITVTLLTYVTIYTTGLLFNEVQVLLANTPPNGYSLAEIMSSKLIRYLSFLAGIFFIGVVVGRANWFYRNRWNHILRFANQKELDTHRGSLDVARFKSKEYDDLQKRIQELPTSWQTRIWFSDELFSLFVTSLSFLIFGMSLLWYKPVYAALLLISSIPMMIVEFKLVSMWWNLFQELVPHHKKRGVLERPYRGVNAFVQALMFNQMKPLRKQIDENVTEVIDAYDRIRNVSVRKEMITHFISTLGLFSVIVHATFATVLEAGAIGTLTVVIATARTFQGNLESIMSLIADQWNNAKGVILIQDEFLALKPLIQTPHAVIPYSLETPTIRFENVGFTYPGSEHSVLNNISFNIDPGKKVAIVGKSGNGKSTIQALLMRYYDPTEGSIYVDDINLKNIEPSVWNTFASSLTQEYTVLERRIGEEIASSRLDTSIDMAAVINSAKFAQFDEVVNDDPEGYNSQIGVHFGGREFSGGEKQRLALARVHYRKTPILILDEPDAKLDPASAEQVLTNVLGLEGVTVVMITHHVSRAEKCDKIIVMGKGEILEEGTHQELIAINGVYAEMYEKDRERLGNSVVS